MERRAEKESIKLRTDRNWEIIHLTSESLVYEYQADYIMEIGQAVTEISIMEIAGIYDMRLAVFFFTTCKRAGSMQHNTLVATARDEDLSSLYPAQSINCMSILFLFPFSRKQVFIV